MPCHSIPLNAAGDTVDSLERDQSKLEEALKEWMRAKISEIEAERGKTEVDLTGAETRLERKPLACK